MLYLCSRARVLALPQQKGYLSAFGSYGTYIKQMPLIEKTEQ